MAISLSGVEFPTSQDYAAKAKICNTGRIIKLFALNCRFVVVCGSDSAKQPTEAAMPEREDKFEGLTPGEREMIEWVGKGCAQLGGSSRAGEFFMEQLRLQFQMENSLLELKKTDHPTYVRIALTIGENYRALLNVPHAIQAGDESLIYADSNQTLVESTGSLVMCLTNPDPEMLSVMIAWLADKPSAAEFVKHLRDLQKLHSPWGT